MADEYTLNTDIGISAMEQAFKITGRKENIVVDQAVDYNFQEGAKTIDFVKYTSLSAVTSGLADGTDPANTAITDSKVTFTPTEYGNVCTYTTLADIGSGGKASIGTGQLVAQNLVDSSNALFFASVSASSDSDITEIWGNDATGTGDLGATDTVTYADLQEAHNKLLSQAEPFDGDYYYLYVHPHVAGDLAKLDEFTGASNIASLYANTLSGQEMVWKNYAGTIAGFRVFTSKECKLTGDGGSGTVDLYESVACGRQAMGKAISLAPQLRVTGPYDKLGRMVHVGWYGIFAYDVVDGNGIVELKSASSYGANS